MELSRFEQLLDGLLEKGKGSADLIQISGGEPTVHPELIAMIRMALDKGVRQVYINTNGIKVASEAYVTALAEFKDRLGIYLQFDGFEPSIYSLLRGRDDLLNIKLKALAHCEAHKLSVVPVMTLTKGINDHQLGAFIKWASASPIVSKVMIQPAMYSGRYENEREVERLTVGEVAKRLATQTGIFCEEDFSPIPCSDPNCFSMAAALRTPKGLIPVSRYFPRYTDWHKPENQALIQSVTDTFDHAESLRSVTAQSASSLMEHLSDEEVETLLDQLVNVEENQLNGDPGGAWKGLFAIGIKPFMDAYTFDQDRIDKCCTHIIARDGTPVSFCEYNALNRPQGRL